MTNYTATTTPATGVNFRTATAHRSEPVSLPKPQPGTPAEKRRSGRGGRYIALAGLAAAAGIGVVAFMAGHDTNSVPVEPGIVGSRPAAELPGDLVVSGDVVTRTYRPDAELTGDLVVSGTGAPTAEAVVTFGERVAADTASRGPNADLAPSSGIDPVAPVLTPVVLGQPVVLFGSVACIPFQHLGPNADLAPDPTGQRSSGIEVLAELRQRGPNVDLPFDPHGMRSSGNDPICVVR